MKNNLTLCNRLLISLFTLGVSSSLLFAQSQPEISEAELIEKGQYISIAADCVACHTAPTENAKPFAGDYVIEVPMGKIVAPNITPSKEYGIGNWSETEFADAVRKGITPDGTRLYPAMPYTAYHGITDEDIHALYTYFMKGVVAVDEPAKEQTELSFPFEYRSLMAIWNGMFLDEKTFTPDPNQSAQINRGEYLIDNLAHCGTCHTPRNLLYSEEESKALSGSNLGGWYAPNITPDPETGIGNWSKEEIVQFLKTGHIENKASSAGEMATAVVESFSKMTDEDLMAIATALKSMNAIHGAVPKAIYTKRFPVTEINSIYAGQGDYQTLIEHNTTDGALLYLNVCAACHGIQGEGAQDQYFPSLILNSTVKSPLPNNLVQVIAEGLHRAVPGDEVFMPGFKSELTAGQIAAITNYVRTHFGNINESISAKDVEKILSGKE
ncbi:cytochrome C [Ignatzschineria ureiclastica]|uniref:Cytochrome C n=1 Tax=Ignatzschineria ureiclastica TaxID=472582 RepID=A0A2U2AH75_9GAMM|nr:c-type cytochrome [Ignatzschineria ureiclastica]PWD82005.1 cytochrome C [Ignatzschineria ureiclastica]GGZ91971.1 cytochrome c [Ignatzschineria ureiclastica]